MNPDTSAKRSARRRIVLLSLLHARPRSYSELIAFLDQQDLLDYDRFEAPALIAQRQKEQFQRDRKALKNSGFDIYWDRPTDCYQWHNSVFGLYFTANQLSAFSLLLDTFEDSQILHSTELQDLLHHLTALLPEEQQKSLKAPRRSFSINLKETTDYRQADPLNLTQVERAIRNGQQLEFLYISPRDGIEKPHRVEPRPLVYERGHIYLKGYSLIGQKEWSFRLDYLVPGSARCLPDLIAPLRPSPTAYRLRYWLSPVIARHRVSQHFLGQKVEAHPDGSATVTAPITDLFEARRIVLSYGENCRVLEAPPDFLAQMRETASMLYKMYCTDQ